MTLEANKIEQILKYRKASFPKSVSTTFVAHCSFDYVFNHAQLKHVTEEKDLGVIVNNTLSWEKHVISVTAKANNLLRLLKRTCPLLMDVSVMQTLYLSLVKLQLCFGTQVWSPSQHYLKAKIEHVQRRAMQWILRTRIGELSYRERLERLNLLPLVLDRELKDLVFFYTCLHGYTDLNIHNFVSFVTHGHTRQSNSFNLKHPLCITSAFQASYFNRIVRLWNTICNSVPKTIFRSLYTFQNYVKETLFDSLKTFDVEWLCTWSSVRLCTCHRP